MDCSVVGWCALPLDAQAAWIQAIFSIIGIGVAIAIPAAQHYLDRRDRIEQSELVSRSMAMALFADFQVISARLNKVWSHEHQDSFEGIDSPPLGAFTQTALELPPHLLAMSDRLHELGPASAFAQKCVYCITRAREFVTTLENGQRVIFDKESFYSRMWDAHGACATVLNTIDGMFDH